MSCTVCVVLYCDVLWCGVLWCGVVWEGGGGLVAGVVRFRTPTVPFCAAVPQHRFGGGGGHRFGALEGVGGSLGGRAGADRPTHPHQETFWHEINAIQQKGGGNWRPIKSEQTFFGASDPQPSPPWVAAPQAIPCRQPVLDPSSRESLEPAASLLTCVAARTGRGGGSAQSSATLLSPRGSLPSFNSFTLNAAWRPQWNGTAAAAGDGGLTCLRGWRVPGG